MATGDNGQTAKEVGTALGIEKVNWALLPKDKTDIIYQLTQKGKRVAMVGDGVNDAPALAAASVGIAMGVVGSDAAIETADVAFMNDNIVNLPKVLKLAKKTKRTVIVNFIASILLSIFAVVFAGTGNIGPVAGALIHNAGAIVVVLNSIGLFYAKL